MRFALPILFAFVFSCVATIAIKLWPELTRPKHVDLAFQIPSPLELALLPTAARFDFPMGSENGALTDNAQRFTENHHLGDDLNGIGGEDSDLGDPIHTIADGRVLLARDGGPGWGNVMINIACLCRKRRAQVCAIVLWARRKNAGPDGDEVRRGQQIATVGTANGLYFAHLYFECANL